MTGARGFLKRHALGGGLVLMFLLTWPIDLANSGLLPVRLPFAVPILVGYGFVVASLLVTWLSDGPGAVVALLRRFLIWRVRPKWYLIAFLLFPVIVLAAVGVNAALTQRPVAFSTVMAHTLFGASANLPLFVVPFLLFDAVTNGEEIGWRGYVLPRLQAKYSALGASLILGVIWGFWHLPKFLASGNASLFSWFMVKVMADAVLYTWLYNNTQGSLLLVTIFHAAGNTAGVFLPVANTVTASNLNTLVLQVVLETLVAIAVVVIEGPPHLSRTEFKQV